MAKLETQLNKSIGFGKLKTNLILLSMIVPGFILFFLFNYLPMFGIIIAFKEINYGLGILKSPWIGFKNFEYLFKTVDAYIITRNTVLYNAAFIILGTFVSVAVAIALNEIKQKFLARFYQSVMFFPYFLSWIAISYLAFSYLSVDLGFINNVIFKNLGIEPVMWYSEPKYWPFILTLVNLWRYTGYNSVIYLAALMGISPTYYEAAQIDGANKWQQIRHITIPLLSPTIVILVLLAIGRIFYADFFLFFNVPLNNGALFDTTNVIDTYVYRALIQMGDIGMAAAASLYQAVIGFCLVLVSNLIVRKIDKEKSLF